MRQRYNECLLASVCAIHGQDYITASDLFRDLHGRSWHCGQSSFSQELHGEFLRYISNGIDYLKLCCSTTDACADYPDLHGSGIVCIRKDDNRHAMAFADGIVYDPATDETLEFGVMMSRFYPDWSVDTVIRQAHLPTPNH